MNTRTVANMNSSQIKGHRKTHLPQFQFKTFTHATVSLGYVHMYSIMKSVLGQSLMHKKIRNRIRDFLDIFTIKC